MATMKTNKIHLFHLLLCALTLSLSAGAHAAPALINGAGATFPYPLYSKWFSDYRKIDTEVEINYQSIGSGGGIRQLMDKTIDFGASDAPMTDEQLSKAGQPVLHIPTVLGAVAVTYNLPGVQTSLKFSTQALAGIYLGQIKNWSDPMIQKLNPQAVLPNTPIMVTHRSDGSGTTAVFADFLSKVSPEWKSRVGVGTSLRWPTGLGAKGNEGVTGLIKQSPGSIGYVELAYAETNRLPVASIENKMNQFVAPSATAITAAAAASQNSIPEDMRVSITYADGKNSYPIAAFTYLLFYQKTAGMKGEKLKKFLAWAIADGQKEAQSLGYAPLPKNLIPRIKARIAMIQTQ